uniref:Macrophage-expressed gene 1 protein n=1 Tax=Panagrolaimus sp. ES5 TaxID=591445 RepID=A0AC34G4Q1_9BILA
MALKDGHKLEAQSLAEVLVADYGTHMINKATASAEIIQETYISRREEFKGETHMNAVKVGVSGEFDGQAYGGGGSVGVENKEESASNDTETTSKTRSLIKTRGGPHINRMGTPNINDSMIHVDNLVGINQQGKFLYDIIPALKLPEFSKMIKYTINELIFNAVTTYYKYNSLPGCMKMTSENYNPLANYDDGSCDDPGVLYSFGGIYQACNPLQAWANFENIEFGKHCEKYERRNRITNDFSCPNYTAPFLIDSMKVQFNDRTVKRQMRKCWRFIPYCWYEEVDVKVLDEIYTATYWCSGAQK